MKNEFYVTTAAESLAGARGKIFLGAPISKFFPEKIFSDNNTPFPVDNSFRAKHFPNEYVVIAFQALYLNFSYQMSVLCQKKPNILPFAQKYFTQKNDWAQQKISRDPQNLGARENLPHPLPPPPPPPSAAMYVTVYDSRQFSPVFF